MRKHYLDNLRYGIVLSVLMYHVVYLFNSVGVIRNVDISGIPAMDGLLYILYPWFMPCLFLISGIATHCALETRTAKEFLRKQAQRLLLPSIAGIFLLGWISGWVTGQYTDLFAGSAEQIPRFVKYLVWCLCGIGPLWYLHQLWVAYLVLFCIRRLDPGERLWKFSGKIRIWWLPALGILFWGSAQIGTLPLVEVYRNGIYIFSFLLGYYVFSRPEAEALLEQNRLLLAILAVAAGAVYVAVYFGQNYTLAENLKSLLTNVYAWLGCLGVLAVGKHCWDRETGFTRYMSGNSFGFYVLHYSLLTFCAWAMDRWLHLPVRVMYPALIVVLAVILPPLTALIRKTPVLNRLLLGV